MGVGADHPGAPPHSYSHKLGVSMEIYQRPLPPSRDRARGGIKWGMNVINLVDYATAMGERMGAKE